MSSAREIRLIEDEDVGGWSAIDADTGVASQGETRQEALENLDEAIALHTGKAGEPVTDEHLQELGVDPERVDPEETAELPEFLR